MLGQREGVCRDRKWCRGCSRGAPCPPPALVKYRNVPSTSFDPFLMSTISCWPAIATLRRSYASPGPHPASLARLHPLSGHHECRLVDISIKSWSTRHVTCHVSRVACRANPSLHCFHDNPHLIALVITTSPSPRPPLPTTRTNSI